jgi:hypothetical protein
MSGSYAIGDVRPDAGVRGRRRRCLRILIIHQYFLGAGDAGGSRFNRFARY